MGIFSRMMLRFRSPAIQPVLGPAPVDTNRKADLEQTAFVNQMRHMAPGEKWCDWYDSCDGGHKGVDGAISCLETKKGQMSGTIPPHDIIAALNASHFHAALQMGVKYQHRIVKRTLHVFHDIIESDEETLKTEEPTRGC